MKPIEFWATINKVQTMVDGGIRVYLDLPESAIMQAAELMTCKRHGIVLNVVCGERKDESGAGKERKTKF